MERRSRIHFSAAESPGELDAARAHPPGLTALDDERAATRDALQRRTVLEAKTGNPIFTHQGAFFEGADGPEMREAGWRKLLDQLATDMAL